MRYVVLLLAAVIAAASCTTETPQESTPIDLRAGPAVTIQTDPLEEGARYSLGHTLSEWAERPHDGIRIQSVEVLHARGIELIGRGAYDAASVEMQLGFIEGWPPVGWDIQAFDSEIYEIEWPGAVVLVLGIEVRGEKAGLRGLRMVWRDATGDEHVSVLDLAVVTCSATACDPDTTTSDELLLDLGLRLP